MDKNHKTDPQFKDTIIVMTENGAAAYLYNAQGQQQNKTEKNGTKLTVFEVKKINGRTFYRVGDQSSWILKSDTNYGHINERIAPKNKPIIQPTSVNKSQSTKMSVGMKILIACFAIVGIIILTGIGYEVIKMVNAPTNSTVQISKSSLKERAAKLTIKQLLALSLIYANRNDDSKLDSNWQSIYDDVSNNNYNIGRFLRYTFGDATVTAKGKNYIYVFEKGIGIGYQDKKGQRLVSFFDKDMSDPVRVYDYQMLEDVNNMAKVKKLANKITFTDESEN